MNFNGSKLVFCFEGFQGGRCLFFFFNLVSLLIAPESADLFLSTDCKNRGRIEG